MWTRRKVKGIGSKDILWGHSKLILMYLFQRMLNYSHKMQVTW